MYTKIGTVCLKHPELGGLRNRSRNCVECARIKVNEWKKQNRERKPKKSALEVQANRKARRRANYLKYQLTKINRVPAWADLKAIRTIYKEAQRLGMSVDHIVPLRGVNVCGLHVENNLRIIPLTDNIAKNNVFTDG